MDGIRIGGSSLCRQVLARLPALVLAALLAGGAAAAPPCNCQYSVINLDPEGGATAKLNEKGQAAFGSFLFGTHGFFDGDRVIDIGTLGGDYTLINDLNDAGTVVGNAEDAGQPFSRILAFSWTRAGGMRALYSPADAGAFAINAAGQVAGYIRYPGVAERAVRWGPMGKYNYLGGLPASLSEASAINAGALAAGYADVAGGIIHATLWNASGQAIDLGTLGGQRGFALFVNDHDEAAGYADTADGVETPFFWSRRDGLVAIGPQDGYARYPAALNARGEIAGNTNAPDGYSAFLWSRTLGLVALRRGAGLHTDVRDMNGRTELVGAIEDGAGNYRAARWSGLAAPVDLNTLLYRPPAGLVLQVGAAINDAGTILAYSNAGLVMLRPGTRGTDAPVLGPVAGLADTVEVGQELRLTLGFVDNTPTQTHAASIDWGDGCTSPLPLVSESGGVGQVSFQHRFCQAGYYILTVQVSDSGGRTTEVRRTVTVNTPGVPTLGGQGRLARGADPKVPPLQFALWTPLGAGAGAVAGTAQAASAPGSGKPFVGLDGPFRFRAEQVAASRSGAQVHLKGSGRLDGRPGYRFVIDAVDGGRATAAGNDRLRVRISHADAAGNDIVDYDNGVPAQGAPAQGAAVRDGPPARDGTAVAHGYLTVGT